MAVDLTTYKALYLETSQDLLNQIKQGLPHLNTETIADIHRAAHSFKSQSLVMGYTQLGLAGRILESLFLGVKEGIIPLSPELITVVKQTLERMDESLAEVRQDRVELNLSPEIRELEQHTAVSPSH